MSVRIVHDEDVTEAERRDQLDFDVDPEGVAVNRAVENPWIVDSVMAPVSDESRRSPVPGDLARQPFVLGCPSFRS